MPGPVTVGGVIITTPIRVIRVVIVRVGVAVGIVTVIRVRSPIAHIRSTGGQEEYQT
jgi:hypothetical protein